MINKITSLFLFSAMLFCTGKLDAQYVTIPDVNFANWLSNNGYYQCMNAQGQLDTLCPAVLNAKSIDCTGNLIADLTGVQYFKALDTLQCSYNMLSFLPVLPNSLQFLDCSSNDLDSIAIFSDSLQTLICEFDMLSNIDSLPPFLVYFDCGNNLMASLPRLPDSLVYLFAGGNFLTSLAPLPSTLQTLICTGNQLIRLPSLPDSLHYLDCSYNQLDSIPTLTELTYLDCDSNLLSFLPSLPNSLQYLYCDFNYQITYLPDLSLSSLTILYSRYDGLLSLPDLPNSLNHFECDDNQIDSLPRLPDSLQILICEFNNLRSLPFLPNTLIFLDCSSNELDILPDLPDSMNVLNCYDNPNLHCFPRLTRIVELEFEKTGVTCLPNYGNVTYSDPPLDSVPLCTPGNQYGCAVYTDVEEIKITNFNLYPNPATAYLIAAFDSYQPGTSLAIYNCLGQVVQQQPVTETNQQIDVSHLAAGLYMVCVKIEQMTIATGRFIKE